MLFNKIKNLFILLKCYLYFLIRGKADKKVQEPKKVLIIQTAKLGDMVCTTPVFCAIKNKYPDCQIHVIGNKINEELLRYNDDINEYLVADNVTIKQLKENNYDFACIITPNFYNLSILYLANIPTISVPVIGGGISPYETRPYKLLTKLVITKLYIFFHYTPREYLKLIEPLHIYTEDTTKKLGYSQEAKNITNNFFGKYNLNRKKDLIIGVAPGVGNKIKKWENIKFAALADYIYQKYQAKILLIGGNDDQPDACEVIKLLNEKTRVINTTGLFNLDQLKALIAKLSLFISVDTGPVYIAEAFGTPTIDIIGPMADNEQPPQGKYHQIVQIANRVPQLHIMNARVYDAKEARRQIEEITVEMVITKVDKLMTDLYV